MLLAFGVALFSAASLRFAVQPLATDPGWRSSSNLEPVLWTEDHSDLVSVLRWR